MGKSFSEKNFHGQSSIFSALGLHSMANNSRNFKRTSEGMFSARPVARIALLASFGLRLRSSAALPVWVRGPGGAL
jgi:hypothetical protein